MTDEANQYNNQPGLDVLGWSDYIAEENDILLQRNGPDCGVFMCKFADCMSDDLDFTFRLETCLTSAAA